MKILAVLLVSVWLVGAQAVPFEGHKIMIAGPSPIAAEVGHQIFKQGGNVTDVTVAVGFALSVTSPYFAALGGGGFSLAKLGGEVEALDFRETAPAATSKDYFKTLDKEASITGGHAVGTPGFVAGLWELHRKHGKLPWSRLVRPAIALAQEGFPVSGEWVKLTNEEKSRFSVGHAVFMESLKPGDVFKQPGLARALSAISRHGIKGFYEGIVAADVVSAVHEAGGRMTLEDLKTYKVRALKPMVAEFAGHQIYLMPPPSSGGVVIATALKLIEKLGLKTKAYLSADELHMLAEIEARAFRGRGLLGDPDFVKNPVAYLTSDAYVTELAGSFRAAKSVKLKPLASGDIKESDQTTHYSVMDGDGNTIALTVTLNGFYGSGVVTKKFGIALNNEMDDFTTKSGEANQFHLIQGEANTVSPGKRPLSSMSPTIVVKDGQTVMSLGSPGGPRIISAVLQVLYRSLVTGLDLDMAVQAPRLHHQFDPDKLRMEKQRFSPEIFEMLRKKGHTVEEGSVAKVYAIKKRSDGVIEGAFDSRGEGGAAGE